MPITLNVDPKKERATAELELKNIPFNRYTPDIRKELELHGEEKLVRIYTIMKTIREFEYMLQEIKLKGRYKKTEYQHKGPAHLSIGQESSSVGLSLNLKKEDLIFGSHRSHGEIISKCYWAMNMMDEEELLGMMKNVNEGRNLSIVETIGSDTLADLSEQFILYSLLSEVFGRDNGFNRGMGGSMHAFFPLLGSMPNNAIVGGSAGIAAGAALYKRIQKKPGIVIANIGDGATACGPVWEAFQMSAMAQYRTLWPDEAGGAPPLMFNIYNNFYGMGGQTSGETMGFDYVARIGAGINADNMHIERIDGLNPLAVADAINRKRKLLESGQGPVLLDTITYRIANHSPTDPGYYRSEDEMEIWREEDCIKKYADYLIENNIADQQQLKEINHKVDCQIADVVELATSLQQTPRVEGSQIASWMYSNIKEVVSQKEVSGLLVQEKKNTRLKSIRRKSRFGYDQNGKLLSHGKSFLIRDAIFESVLHALCTDHRFIAFGEDNRDYGGAFGVYRGLMESIPYTRLFNTPIAEAAIIASAVGYAMCGGRVVVEIMFSDFIGRAGDELFNQLAKWQAMSGGELVMPVVVRVSVGNQYGAQHAQDWTSLIAHIPGLKIYYPATPYDAKGMLNTAINGSDPVLFFESQKLYNMNERFHGEGVPVDYYEIPEGQPELRKAGKDITIISIGPALYTAMEASTMLERQFGVSTEIIDLRFINPVDLGLVIESVKKTGKALIVSEACERGSYAHNLVSDIQTIAFDYLDAPVAIVGSNNWITPPAEMESSFFPQPEWILDTIHERILPLPGYTPSTNRSSSELMRLRKSGC